MGPLTVHPVTPDDLPAVSELTVATFYQNPHTLSHYIFPRDREAEVAAWSLRYTEFVYHNTPDTFFYKLVDDASGVTVAFSVWQVPRSIGSPEEEAKAKQEKQELQERIKHVVGLPASTNVARLECFDQEQDRLRDKYVDFGKDFMLKLIAVSPKCQGQGCGSQLLRAGLETVDAAGARAYIEATPLGKPLYQKFGWREVDQIVSKVEEKHEGIHVTTCMIRDPQKSNRPSGN